MSLAARVARPLQALEQEGCDRTPLPGAETVSRRGGRRERMEAGRPVLRRAPCTPIQKA